MATDVRKLAQDAAYVTVGVGVLAFQRAQVARREARSRFEAQLAETRSTVSQLRARVEPLADQVQARLPEPLAKVVERARSLQSRVSSAA